MSSNDYVKFLTEQIVQYMNQPRDQRRQYRQEKKVGHSFGYRWFGLIPMALGFFFKNRRKR